MNDGSIRFHYLISVYFVPYSFRGNYIYRQHLMAVNWTPKMTLLMPFSASLLLEQLIIKILLFGLAYTSL